MKKFICGLVAGLTLYGGIAFAQSYTNSPFTNFQIYDYPNVCIYVAINSQSAWSGTSIQVIPKSQLSFVGCK